MDVIEFRDDVENPEGPVSLADGSWLITEMDLNIISHVSVDGAYKHEIAETGLPNGLAIDDLRNIWVADARWRALLKVNFSGEVTEVSKGTEEVPFLLPNDLCFGPDNAVYMTDSGIPLDEFANLSTQMEAYDLQYDGKVLRIEPETNNIEIIDRGLRLTNGIAFGPGGKVLYVAETLTGNIYRYNLYLGYSNTERRLFGNVMVKEPREFGRIAGPDGMAFDRSGNLYVTVLVQGDISIMKPGGKIKERIKLEGDLPTNIAFDQPGSSRALITEASKKQLLHLQTDQEGLPLYPPQSRK
jgi:gluconolactonase